MKLLTLIIVLSACFGYSEAQTQQAEGNPEISFEINKKTISKDRKEDKIYKIIFTSKNLINKTLDSCRLEIVTDMDSTTIPALDYLVEFKPAYLNTLNGINSFYLTIKKDEKSERSGRIALNLIIKNKNGKLLDTIRGKYKQMDIMVDNSLKKDSLSGFKYLAYIGTNFDLVDGIKARNLFFASNVFLAPKNKRWNIGFYLSLFGNRTMTATDSLNNVLRTYKRRGLSDSTTMKTTEQSDLRTTKISDNLGAYMSGLVHLGGISDENNDLKVYYSPSLEFLWRRTQTTNIFSNGRNRDSVITKTYTPGVIEMGNKSIQYANEYNFNIGFLGFFIVHETKQISMRVHLGTGWSRQFYPDRNSNTSTETNMDYLTTNDLFFTGRAWITEATSGLTLQAEVTNTSKRPRPYFGVTLSKALNFKNLGTFFSPITSR